MINDFDDEDEDLIEDEDEDEDEGESDEADWEAQDYSDRVHDWNSENARYR